MSSITLKEYLEKEDLTPAAFGRLIGVKSRSTVKRYIDGIRIPDRPVMQKINEVTNGQVTANSFYQ